MAILKTTVIIIVLRTLYDVTAGGRSRIYFGARIDYFWACKNRTLPNRMENTSISQLSRDLLTVNADIDVVKGSSKLPAKMVILRCATRGDEVCEPFLRMADKDFCHVFTDKGQFWSVFYDSVFPRPTCPIKKGQYQIRNATVDFNMMFKNVPPMPEAEDFYWKFRTQIYSYPENEEILCITGGGKLEKFKKRS